MGKGKRMLNAEGRTWLSLWESCRAKRRFPKFVVGFILASLVFSFLMDVESAKAVGKITKGFTNTLFSIAFVCVGLETRFADIFSKENRKPLWAFLLAQGFNIIVTLVVAYLLFGIVKPMLA